MHAKQAITRPRFTKTVVEALAPSKTPHWDAELSGFGVLVSARGTRTYLVQKRLPDGHQIKVAIGRHGAWTTERARARAKVLLGQIAAGINPVSERRATRQAERQRLEAPTVEALLERYMEEHAEPRKRLSSVRSDRSLIHKHILPQLGRRRVAEITSLDVERLHRQLSTARQVAANRVLALVSKAMNLAIRWGWRSDNPCRGVQRNPEAPRERYLSQPELGRLRDALNRRHGQLEAGCVAFLLLTGCRRGEVLTARWRDFDPSTGVWVKPSAHTKQARIHRVPLSTAARALLVQLAEQFAPDEPPPDGYVFGGPAMAARLRRAWLTVRSEAGLPGLRLHDLRHAYASVLVSGGLSLPVVGCLLGHTQPRTTARYAHLFDAPLRQATERVSTLWQALPDGGQ